MCITPNILTLLSTGLKVFSAISGANAEEDQINSQIQQNRRLSELENKKAQREVENEERNLRRVQGSQVAGFAANGISIDGSAAATILDSERESDRDIEAIRFGNNVTQQNIQFENTQLVERRSNVKKSGILNAIGAGISGATKLQGAF